MFLHHAMPTAYDKRGRCRPYVSFSGVTKEREQAAERATQRERETQRERRETQRIIEHERERITTWRDRARDSTHECV